MPLSWPYGVTGPVVGQMFHVKHWLWWRSCSGRRMARPWGRAASCARGRRPSCCCCLWSHGCSGRRRPRPLCVPVGGGTPALRASLGASSRSPARPCLRPRVPQPDPVGQLGRLSETAIAFARLCLCGSETAIAFAGVKWAFLVQFSGAVVMSVSTVPCWWRAVVLLVSTSPCCRGPAFVGSRWASLLCRRSSSGPSAGGVNPSMRS